MLFPNFRFRKHKEIAKDFITNILELDYATTAIFPQASLWHYSGLDGYEEFPARIKDRYGVDITGIEDDSLLTIFELIAKAQKARR